MNGKRLVLFGCGGHARSVADVAVTAGFEQLMFVDDHAGDDESILGFPVQRDLPVADHGWEYIACAGDNRKRLAQIRMLLDAALPLASVISSRATIGLGASIGPGCFIGHNAHLGPEASIGPGCVLNTGAVVEHQCVVGQGCHVSPHACVAGHSQLGDCVFLGAGAIVIDGVSVATDVTIGAGGVVISTIDSPGVYVGVPVRRV
jgi:UDP-N-acetylbacillosamine N-acetyltransferase